MFSSIINILAEKNRSWSSSESFQKAIDSKVSGVLIDRIIPIFKSCASSSVVGDFEPSFEITKMAYLSFMKERSKNKRGIALKKGPIGLRFVDSEGLVNAFMQFILFIPSLAELFMFAPRKMAPFQKFIDQYRLDQEQNQLISHANGAAILWCIKMNWERSSLSALFEKITLELCPELTSDLFLTKPTLDKQIFQGLDCYDLDAFIEARSCSKNLSYIVYVKVEGMWYQCDNERIVSLRSNHLKIPLSRSVLLHYKKVVY